MFPVVHEYTVSTILWLYCTIILYIDWNPVFLTYRSYVPLFKSTESMESMKELTPKPLEMQWASSSCNSPY